MELSFIFDEEDLDLPISKKHGEAALIFSNGRFEFYRLAVDGKSFLFKTPAKDSARLNNLLRREYEIASGCSHPHIAEVIAHGEMIPGKTGILMEYIDGRSLTEFLKEDPARKTRERIICELLEAVSYLHKRGVVHNDLKPDNILISRNGDRLKLIDFGLSDTDTYCRLHTPGFTPEYAAPELAENHHSDARSDIYSLGKIIQETVGGKHRNVVRKATAHDPAKRFQNVDMLSDALKRKTSLMLFCVLPAIIIVGCVITILLLNTRKQETEQPVPVSVAESRPMLEPSDSAVSSIVPRESSSDQPENPSSSDMDPAHGEEIMVSSEEAPEAPTNAEIDSYIVEFRKHLKSLTDQAAQEISLCKNASEIYAAADRFMTTANEYYDTFPSELNGVDLSLRLNQEFRKALGEASEIFRQTTDSIITE